MRIKFLLIMAILVFSFVNTVTGQGVKTRYYQKRLWNDNKYEWVYKKSLSASKAKKIKFCYTVRYNSNNKISKVEFPFLPTEYNGRVLCNAVELYSNGKIMKRSDSIGKKEIAYRIFKYDKSGKPTKEEYYRKQYYPEKKWVLHTTIEYLYRGRRLMKRACYAGVKRHPAGTWYYYIYFKGKRKLAKVEKYEMNYRGQYKLQLLTKFVHDGQGRVVAEKSFSEGKRFGDWNYYDKYQRPVKKEQYFDGQLIRSYKYTYNSKGRLSKRVLSENGKPVETLIYNDEGKIVDRR